MRVITGKARGMKLKTLDGYDTRPTSDRIKESIFNIIQFDIEGRRIADIFAGSGQIGIEALSRGAREAYFADSGLEAVKVIKANLEHTRMKEYARVVHSDAKTFISGTREKFDIIFLDPPYKSNLLETALNQIALFDILSPGGIIICESPSEGSAAELKKPYFRGREYLYGKIKITLYHRESE